MSKVLVIAVVCGLVLAQGAVLADPVQKVNAFVCPVLTLPQALVDMIGTNLWLPFFPIYGGDYSLLPGHAGEHDGSGNLWVPEGATNGDGDGSPAGPHAAPGDTNYTAIWSLG